MRSTYHKQYYETNKERILARKKERYQENPDKYWESNLKYKFGITASDYETLYEKQDGKCAICSATPGHRKLATDHDHNTGEVRGLLCSACNTSLGGFQDDEELLKNAIGYLRTAKTSSSKDSHRASPKGIQVVS